MKTHGPSWNGILILAMFWTTMVLFMSLPISPQVDSTLGENIFGPSEHRQGRKER